MDNNFENYHHHQWRQGPTQPTICPICTAPHFPFCSPYPPSSFSHNPSFPPHLNSPRPGFDSFTGPPVRPQNHYPIGDPRPWQAHHGNQWRPVSDYSSGVDCDREVDRSYKRARIDVIGDGSPGYGVSGSDGYQSPRISWENERRLKMVRDHGYGLTAPSPGNLDVSNMEMNHPYGRGEVRNGGQFNGVAPHPMLHHPPLPAAAYGGYFGGPNGQPPLPVSPPPPLPPSHPQSHPSSLFPVTTNSSAMVPPSSSSYSQMPNAPVMLRSWFRSYLEISYFCCTDDFLLFGSRLLHN